MKRRLSSILVPIYKLIPILIWSSVVYWLFRDFRNIAEPGLIFLFFVGVIWHFVTLRWKSVYLQERDLIVSNFIRRIVIPINQIESIEPSSFWGWQPQTIKLVLKNESDFGSEIIYVPRWLGLHAKPFAEELRKLLASKR